jgi:hypothetical protein
MARNTDRRAQGNTARPSGQDPSARLGNGFTSQSEPTSRAARTHPRTPRPRRPTPQRGSNPRPRAPAAVRDFHTLATIPPGCNGLESMLASRCRPSLLAPLAAYSSQVQQPLRTEAALGKHPHMRWPAPFNHEQDRASSYGSEGWGSSPSERAQVFPGRRADHSSSCSSSSSSGLGLALSASLAALSRRRGGRLPGRARCLVRG